MGVVVVAVGGSLTCRVELRNALGRQPLCQTVLGSLRGKYDGKWKLLLVLRHSVHTLWGKETHC